MNRKEKNSDYYSCLRRERFEEMLSSSQSYDKAVLTLASAALGLSFALIRLDKVFHCLSLLYISWVFLFLSIGSVLISFWFVQKHAITQMEYDGEYYLQNKEEYKDKKHWCSSMMAPAKIASGVCFFLALLSLAFFISANLVQNS